MNIHAVDLNLLLALHALLDEASVTRAARRAGLSQPAMSHALARLRLHFDDPLLVRSGRGMVRTARALALQAEVADTVRRVDALFDARGFTPATDPVRFRLVADDHIGCTLLPGLVADVSARAPAATVEVAPRGSPGRKALVRAGEADLALGYFSGAGMDLCRRELWEDTWVCLTATRHPELHEVDLDLERWLRLPHVVVSPTGGTRGAVDRALARTGCTRAVALTVPHFTTALAVVAATPFVLTTSASLAGAQAARFGLRMHAPPIELAPFAVSMVWHPRTDADPAHRWLRDRVAERARARDTWASGSRSPCAH